MSDNTASARQLKRLSRMHEKGISRSTVMVHERCKPVLEALRPHFIDPGCAETLARAIEVVRESVKPINVSQVSQLSPFRYPGGKTWLIPEVRSWIQSLPFHPSVFVEPFAGGAITGLTMASEGLAKHVVLSELDDDVAAVWDIIISGTNRDAEWLCKQILSFEVNLENVKSVIFDTSALTKRKKAFRTIVKNRTQRGGILAPGAGIVKVGENGKGLLSRWYPETLAKRIRAIRKICQKLQFVQRDAFEVIAEYQDDPEAIFFIDPPYTAGGKSAGSRLYTHSVIDHDALFTVMRDVQGQFLMTYDCADEVKDLAARNGFKISFVPMKNTHHEIIYELLITKS